MIRACHLFVSPLNWPDNNHQVLVFSDLLLSNSKSRQTDFTDSYRNCCNRSYQVRSSSHVCHFKSLPKFAMQNTVKNPMKEQPFLRLDWQRFLNYGHLTGHFVQLNFRWGRGIVITLWLESLLVAVQSVKGHICFSKTIFTQNGL